MSKETIEQAKARLKRQDEAKEEVFRERQRELEGDAARRRAEDDARVRTQEREREKLHEDLREKREQEMKDSALGPWLDAGGTKEEFEEAWPQIRRRRLEERALVGSSKARQESFGLTRSSF